MWYLYISSNLLQKESQHDSVISDLRQLAKDTRYNQYISESTLKETFTNLILAG